jgi:hypothetical protein
MTRSIEEFHDLKEEKEGGCWFATTCKADISKINFRRGASKPMFFASLIGVEWAFSSTSAII